MTRTTAPTLNVVNGPPTVTAPNSRVYFTTTLGSGTVPIWTWWSACDPNAIASYQLQQSVNGGAFAPVSLPTQTTTGIGLSLTLGATYRYEVLATDANNNTSAFVLGASFQPLLIEDSSTGSIAYSGTWTLDYSSSTSGGDQRYTTQLGASASYTFTGSSIGWVASRGPDRGSADVYIDGVLRATVNLNASSLVYKQIVWIYNFGVNGTHTIKVVNDATSGHPRIDVDAFVRTLQL